MPWSRKLAAAITLNDGRTIATLSQAREMMLSLPIAHRRGDMWRNAADLLGKAAADNSYVTRTEAEAQFIRSLKTEGLLECPATTPQPSATTPSPRSRSSVGPSTAGPTGWRGQTW
jgi:hypothetical protein